MAGDGRWIYVKHVVGTVLFFLSAFAVAGAVLGEFRGALVVWSGRFIHDAAKESPPFSEAANQLAMTYALIGAGLGLIVGSVLGTRSARKRAAKGRKRR